MATDVHPPLYWPQVADKDRFEAAFRLWHDMDHFGIEPSYKTASQMLQAVVKFAPRLGASIDQEHALHAAAVDHIFAMFNKGLLVTDEPTLRAMVQMLAATRQYARMLRLMDVAKADYGVAMVGTVFQQIVDKCLVARGAPDAVLADFVRKALASGMRARDVPESTRKNIRKKIADADLRAELDALLNDSNAGQGHGQGQARRGLGGPALDNDAGVKGSSLTAALIDSLKTQGASKGQGQGQGQGR
jgi:hypothetical protein